LLLFRRQGGWGGGPPRPHGPPRHRGKPAAQLEISVGGKGNPHHHHGNVGHGWNQYINHEKHRLKYEILKLKAKKKIAVLQNTVELKKLVSLLLQKGIQALEWW